MTASAAARPGLTAGVPACLALEADAVTVRLDGRTVLGGVDLAVALGEWLTVLGPNGAGKSTLLRVLAGLQTCTGTVRLNGVDLRALPARSRARGVAYVPQQPVLPPGMSVLDYVLLGRTAHQGWALGCSPADVALATAVLQRLDLDGFAWRPVDRLSGGERQRAVIARALAQEAPVLLLDEPTTSLDVGHQQEVLELLDSLRAEHGLTVVSTLHDLPLAGQFSDRIVLLAAGEIVAGGPPATVLTADLLWQHFGADVAVVEDGDGVVVVPRRRRERPPVAPQEHRPHQEHRP
jgi:iron complex transport system ATP-binding protein